ncbi:WbqC family protein [Prevotella dentasini]|uniref:WbqC family protein n=1 Tax=Prevotella dentasini TaxID=589537 RepID=UPI00055AC751
MQSSLSFGNANSHSLLAEGLGEASHNLGEALLSSAYFGPVQWYQKLNRYDLCLIECHDNFVKQTYRNRCIIAAANGPQTLSIPIEKFDGPKCPIKDVRISDHGNWRHIHWNALLSAYGESPFFEYYQDDLRPFFEKRWEYLFDFNMEITARLCDLLDIRPSYRPTDEFVPLTAGDDTASSVFADFREAIRPKHPAADADFQPRPYYQVYQQRYGFLPNLSILDLLFNEGNEAVLYL